MIKVLIIEDEIPARKKLKRFLDDGQETIEICAEIDNIGEAIAFLKQSEVDLIFSDIELLDGNAFEIYQQVTVKCPIIFTTAYDQFWMNAFETNGIEYLLKPFTQERFQKAWNKFLLLKNSNTSENNLLSKLKDLIESKTLNRTLKNRFMVRSRQGMYFVEVENITFFTATEGVVYAFDTAGKKHFLNETTLKDIENQLDTAEFFRINRSELVQKKHIEKIERYTKNTFSIKIKGYSEDLKTSQSQTAAFRSWVEK